MPKEVQQVTIKQSVSTRYGTIQRALITAINNCMAVNECGLADELLNAKRIVDAKYNNLIEANIEWRSR